MRRGTSDPGFLPLHIETHRFVALPPLSPSLPISRPLRPCALEPLRLLVQQRHISHLLERLTVSVLAFYIPHIYSLADRAAFVVAVPRDVYITALEDQHSKPVEDLKLVVNHFLPYRREEELVYLRTSCRQIGTFSIGPSLLGVKTVEKRTSPAGSTVTPGERTYLSEQCCRFRYPCMPTV